MANDAAEKHGTEGTDVALDMRDLPAQVREFASYKSITQGCSPKTVEEYCLDLRTFFRYIVADRERLSLDDETMDRIEKDILDRMYTLLRLGLLPQAK